ncbi:carboxypeptidase regulatory-like domain-containing protein, partial [candidate division WOR-3 bacterium]|nr:carboxypeptidase regulatory-like domain-containing protein [candidate division WOR-3 bacterium]
MKTLTALACLLVLTGAALADGGIAGTVTDARTGEPVAGAMVLARSGNDVGRAQANARGGYVIENLEPGRYEVSVSARGYLPARQGPVGVREGEITRGTDFALERPSRPEPGAITGRVTDAVTGEPLRHAAVVAVSQGCRRRVRTDERGDYTLRGLVPGAYRVTAEARHYVRQTLPRAVEVRAGQTVENVNLMLRP